MKRKAHHLERQEQVREDDGSVYLENLGGLDGDLGSDRRPLADFDQRILFADGAIFRHVSARLAHEPERRALSGLGLGGPHEEGIGGGHEPTT